MHPYASELYALAFRPLQAIYLPTARTHALRRSIAGTEHFDAAGCYPICVFDARARLDEDMRLLADHGCVSLVLVTDCLTQPNADYLEQNFEHCRPYKTHFTYDSSRPNANYSKHHRDRVRRAHKSCETRMIDLSDHLEAWLDCYATLVDRKGISGIQNFSRSYFESLAGLPNVKMIGAFADGVLVSAHIWIHHEAKLYAHLAASTPLGYKLRSAFAIYDHAIQTFGPTCQIDFGGGAGVEAGKEDGLADFKRGFANGEVHNFLCGNVLLPKLYASLCATRNVLPSTSFFPAYRTQSGAALQASERSADIVDDRSH